MINLIKSANLIIVNLIKMIKPAKTIKTLNLIKPVKLIPPKNARTRCASASVNRKIFGVTRKLSAAVKKKILHLCEFSKSFIISL